MVNRNDKHDDGKAQDSSPRPATRSLANLWRLLSEPLKGMLAALTSLAGLAAASATFFTYFSEVFGWTTPSAPSTDSGEANSEFPISSEIFWLVSGSLVALVGVSAVFYYMYRLRRRQRVKAEALVEEILKREQALFRQLDQDISNALIAESGR